MLDGTIFRDLNARSRIRWYGNSSVSCRYGRPRYDLYRTTLLWVLTDESHHKLSCTLSCTLRPLPHLRFRQRESCTTALVQSPSHQERWKGPLLTLVNFGWSQLPGGLAEPQIETINRHRRHRASVIVCASRVANKLYPFFSLFYFLQC